MQIRAFSSVGRSKPGEMTASNQLTAAYGAISPFTTFMNISTEIGLET